MSEVWCAAAGGALRLTVQVAPNARKSETAGVLDGALKIRLQAQPIEGRANEALVRFIATQLGVPKSAVAITHGLASRRKTVEVRSTGLTAEAAAAALQSAD
jgi:uncharacterized protein (TIGR00251 family)